MPVKVFYLDDEADLVANFFETFSSESVEVTCFTDVRTAMTAVRTSPPDVFFIDFRLPNTVGDKVAAEMNATFPIALVTGEMRVQTDYKFAAVFEKPINEQQVLNFIMSCAR
jgi:FixJ family two-component response regulator